MQHNEEAMLRISQFLSRKMRRGGYYQEGDWMSSIGNIVQGDTPDVSGMATDMNPATSLMKSGLGIGKGIHTITDGNKYNQGTGWGSAIGGAADAVGTLIGIPTMGLGTKVGSVVGSMFDKEDKRRPYVPSGNTTGNFRQFQMGGVTTLPGETLVDNRPYRDTSRGNKSINGVLFDVENKIVGYGGPDYYKQAYKTVSESFTPDEAIEAYNTMDDKKRTGDLGQALRNYYYGSKRVPKNTSISRESTEVDTVLPITPANSPIKGKYGVRIMTYVR